jgi:two-component system nitrogen regulation sensor histidine kinase GlnL
MLAPLPDHPGWLGLAIQNRGAAALADSRRGRDGAVRAMGAAAMLAHEIKNPLSGIRGAAQLLESSIEEDQSDLTRLIRDEVDRIAALIDRMEGFTDTRPLVFAPLNIHVVLSRVRELAEQGFARGISIKEIYDPSLPNILGNRDALIQVFLNLLKNAAEALGSGAPGDEIKLTTAYRHGFSVARNGTRIPLPIEICVIDTGPGAPGGITENMFDPFVSSKPSGTGLGLALVAKLVEDHGGIINYAREGRPERTVLRVLLPRA